MSTREKKTQRELKSLSNTPTRGNKKKEQEYVCDGDKLGVFFFSLLLKWCRRVFFFLESFTAPQFVVVWFCLVYPLSFSLSLEVYSDSFSFCSLSLPNVVGLPLLRL
jgi:hypothetical protein